jgi:hypothetical protein
MGNDQCNPCSLSCTEAQNQLVSGLQNQIVSSNEEDSNNHKNVP